MKIDEQIHAKMDQKWIGKLIKNQTDAKKAECIICYKNHMVFQ